MTEGALARVIDGTRIPGDMDEFMAVVEAVDKKKPSQKDLEKLRQFLETTPGLWRVFSDLADLAAGAVMKEVSLPRSMQEALKVGLEEMRRDLGYDQSPMLERFLTEQVVLCWMRLNIVEMKHGQATSGQHSFREGESWDKRLSAAQRRYMRACETLARVRKLVRQTPMVQVNTATEGGQQVNVLSSGGA